MVVFVTLGFMHFAFCLTNVKCMKPSLIYRYYTIIDVYTTALLPTKPSSDDDSEFWHGFRAEASLPLTQSVPAVSHDTTRLYQIVVTL